MFADRADAGRRLAAPLLPWRDRDPVVLALPRGGVPVGAEIAEALGAPLDVVLVRKIGAPFNPEFAIGAMVDGEAPDLMLNEAVIRRLGIPQSYVEAECVVQRQEIERRRRLYRGDRPPCPVSGRTAIVVDDGIATGSTVRVALQAVRRAGPAHLILAAPVAPPDTLAALAPDCDAVVCLETPADFRALSPYYADFRQLEDAEVVEILERAARRRSCGNPLGSG